MSPNDNGGLEDFVLIDDPTQITSSNGDTSGRNACNSPVEPDYVTVDSDDPTISAEQKVVLASTPVGRKQPTVQIEYFEPMFLSDFPYTLTEEVLMAPIPSKYQAPKDEVNMPHSTADPQSVFVTNANLLLECFFHFEGVHPKIGRDFVFYTVGKACELRAEQAGYLQQHVDCIFDILRERRMAFLRRTEGTFILRAEDHNVRELARLVDRYINFDSEEPQEVEEKWYMNPAFQRLWFEWQDILQNKGLRTTKGPRKTDFDQTNTREGRERSRLVSEAVLAADRLNDAMTRLDVCGGLRSGALTKDDRLLLRRALDRATRWTGRVKGPRGSDLHPQARRE